METCFSKVTKTCRHLSGWFDSFSLPASLSDFPFPLISGFPSIHRGGMGELSWFYYYYYLLFHFAQIQLGDILLKQRWPGLCIGPFHPPKAQRRELPQMGTFWWRYHFLFSLVLSSPFPPLPCSPFTFHKWSALSRNPGFRAALHLYMLITNVITKCLQGEKPPPMAEQSVNGVQGREQ